MRAILEVAHAHRRFAADHQLSDAIAHAVIRDVVLLLEQALRFFLGHRAGLHHELQQVLVVLVVHLAGVSKRLTQYGVGLNLSERRLDVGFGGQRVLDLRQVRLALTQASLVIVGQLAACQIALDLLEFEFGGSTPKVQRVVALVVRTQLGKVQRKQPVGSIGAACGLNDSLLAQALNNLANVDARNRLDDPLAGAVFALFLDQLGHAIGQRQRS